MGNQVIESTPIWPFLIAIVILTAALVWFAWQFWMLKQNKVSEKKEESPSGKNSVQELKEQLKANEKAFIKLNPIVERYVNLRDGMDDVVKKATVKERLEALHKLMEKAEVWDKKYNYQDGLTLLGKLFNEAEILTQAESRIKLIQRKIQQFYGQLRIIDLDEEAECQIRSDFLELSMMMMDVLESINNANYNEALQGLNVQLLEEQITHDEAVTLSAPITNLDIETSLWARKLFKSIEKWAGTPQKPLIEQRSYLLNGMRFEFNNQ